MKAYHIKAHSESCLMVCTEQQGHRALPGSPAVKDFHASNVGGIRSILVREDPAGLEVHSVPPLNKWSPW